MNKDFKYILQPYKGTGTRYTCPKCNKRNQFARYINTETLQPLADHVGRCNREVNCGHHYTPKQFFEDNPGFNDSTNEKAPVNKTTIIKPPQPAPIENKISLIPFKTFEKTLKAYDNNNLINFLINRIGQAQTEEVIQNYYLGTSKHWQGATIFWQIDLKGRIRTGKVMLYNPETGKRIKEPFAHINWIHKIGSFKNYNLKQCLFGEHLLNLYPEKNIAIVESEKTALIASAYIPENNWLASGNLNNLNQNTLQPLKGKLITLYPDAGAFNIWKKKADQLKDIAKIQISNLIETRATPQQIKEGFDLADYLTEKPEKFIPAKELEQTKKTTSNYINKAEVITLEKETDQFFDNSFEWNNKNKVELWPVEELENFFNNTTLPDQPVNIGSATVINDVKKYLESNLMAVKNNNGNPIYKPYFERLQLLKNTLEIINGGMA